MARCPQPFEILQTFKPKRGALHLGNFASMGELPGQPTFVDVVGKLKTDAQQRLGYYPDAPRTPAIPITTLAMAMAVSKLVHDAMPKAWQIASDSADNVTFEDFITGEGRVGQSLARAVKRWNDARFKFMSRPWSKLGKTWAQAENLTPDKAGGVAPLVLATLPLNYEEAALFWDEAGRIAIHIKVLLDRPFDSKWRAAYDSIGVDIDWAVAFFTGAVESVVKVGIQAVLKLLKAAGKGAASGFWAEFGTVLVLGGVGLGGIFAWKLWRKRRA